MTLSHRLCRLVAALAVAAGMTLLGAPSALAGPPPDGCGDADLLPPLRNDAGQMLGQASVAVCAGYGRVFRVDDTRTNGLQFGLVVHDLDGRNIPYPQRGLATDPPTSYSINYPVSTYYVCDGLNLPLANWYCNGPYEVG